MLKDVITEVLKRNNGKCLDVQSEFGLVERELNDSIKELIKTEINSVACSPGSDDLTLQTLKDVEFKILGLQADA